MCLFLELGPLRNCGFPLVPLKQLKTTQNKQDDGHVSFRFPFQQLPKKRVWKKQRKKGTDPGDAVSEVTTCEVDAANAYVARPEAR